MNLALPPAGRGRRTATAQAAYLLALQLWCNGIKDIASRLEFSVSTRGWCYILEEHGLAKGDFDKAERLIVDCRKRGLLPLDICAEDARRTADGLERLDEERLDDEVDAWIKTLEAAHLRYTPWSFWDDKDVYLELLVEKIDLKSLFLPICRKFRIPVTNAVGWSDLNSRAAMMSRFQQWEAKGKQPVLLYGGDHDPAGLLIADSIKSNLGDLSSVVGWSPDRLIVDRFGLNRDFIDQHNLSWIEGLETGSGKNLADPHHEHHRKPYVQAYLRDHGARKVEANALVVRPDAGRQLLRDTIAKYLPDTAPHTYERSLDGARAELRLAIVRRLSGMGGAE